MAVPGLVNAWNVDRYPFSCRMLECLDEKSGALSRIPGQQRGIHGLRHAAQHRLENLVLDARTLIGYDQQEFIMRALERLTGVASRHVGINGLVLAWPLQIDFGLLPYKVVLQERRFKPLRALRPNVPFELILLG